MKFITGICLLVAMLSVPHYAEAKPLLVVVELPHKDDIRQWVDLGYPTYEFLNRHAVAEIDDELIPGLRSRGFRVTVIDESPWTEDYFVTTGIDDIKETVPGICVWRREDISVLKVERNDIPRLYDLNHLFQPMRKRILPMRFWEQYLVKKVSTRSIPWDPFIQGLVDGVSTDSITAFIQRLQDFKTRLVLSDSGFAASEWLRQKFNGWGYTTRFDSFYIDSSMAAWGVWPGVGFERNIIATSNGTMNPDQLFIIGGHMDAIVWWDTSLARYNAPGADDNATGTVAALEAARVFKDYSWESTIEFIGWAAEEIGLYGSYFYADRADSLDLDVGGVINGDMIGYMDDANLDCIIQRKDSPPLWLSELFESVGETYVPSLSIYPVTSGGGSDWYPFAVNGFAAVGAAERSGSHYNPHYHDTSDVLTTLTPALYTAITKVSVATLAVLGIYPSMVKDVLVQDMGNGTQLRVIWTVNPETDIAGYRVSWGTESEVYTDTHYVAGAGSTEYTMTGLMTDSTYYITVRAVDMDDHESYVAVEKTGIPRTVPLAPVGVTATPVSSGIRIDWLPNNEIDLAGYRLYRRLNDNPTYDSLNTSLLSDTTFMDTPLSGEHRYYYALRAFDETGNPSPYSTEAYGRPITLDQGILVVDETKNWTTGNFPHDTLQDAFYAYILQNYPFTAYEYGLAAEQPVLADFVPYSTVVWFADDYIELMASGNIDDFASYFDVGGNIWFVGWKAAGNLAGSMSYPLVFSSGDIEYDYFKIDRAALSASSDSFQGAIGQMGYPNVAVDPAKVPLANWGPTLRYIEALIPAGAAEPIYIIDMQNNTSPFEGEVCGVRCLGDFGMVFLGYPVYFMDADDARLLAEQVMIDFGEVGVVEYGSTTIVQGTWLRAVPNPFLRKTELQYQISAAGRVTLRVFNVLGQVVRRVVDEVQPPGVYTVSWDGRDDHGHKLASGVYFTRLETEGTTEITKLTILR